MKRLLLLMFVLSAVNVYAQDNTDYPKWVTNAMEHSQKEIMRMYELSELTVPFWMPSLYVDARINGYFIDGYDAIPVLMTIAEVHIFRFSRIWGEGRMYWQVPLTDQSYSPLNDMYFGFGGAFGVNLIDTRKVHMSGGHKHVKGWVMSVAGEGYHLWNVDDEDKRIYGGGAEVKAMYSFNQFFGLSAGLNVSGGNINIYGDTKNFISFGGSIGLTF
ncbi:MAG: hypothetical protein ATN35_05715 [Epulopiscium sp. Nele67-Bin004]|nr:MAG: hypothetical protein ATN35_05715 [Epulopiscium sp. Nele67-Bin004]